jgi:lipoprotein-anchoring transpeptidase ErfK/SrfK
MSGGEGNPLGARAIYLYDDEGKDTLFRIHGTNEPWSIGLNASSGCIRMLNENVIELHAKVKLGAKVIVT